MNFIGRSDDVIIRIQSVGDVTIFHCAGRLTFGSEDTVLSAVSKLSAVDLAVLDLAKVPAIDAAGLGALVSIRNWIKTKGVTLKLMNVTRRVEKLLELSNLRSVFEFCSVPEMLRLLCRAFEQSRFGDMETEAESSRYLTQPAEAITPVPNVFSL